MLPRYSKYKNSGVEWLGDVPESWRVVAIKWLSPVLRGASPRPIEDPKYFDEFGEYSWVRISDVSASEGKLKSTEQRLSSLGAALSVKLQPGSLFLSIAGSVGKPCITEIKACIHDGFVFFPKLRIDPEFLYRIFESGACYGGLGKLGTQLNLNTDTVGSIRVALPDPDEMQLILSFLDSETAKIDAMVAEQEKLIELLKEKRQAVISHAVTKGLDPKAPMKDSGIEWLGKTPQHWSLSRVGVLCSKIGSGKTPLGGAESYANSGILFLRSQNVYDEGLLLEEVVYISEEIDGGMQGSRVLPGDILLNITGASLGRTCLVPDRFEPANVNQHVCIVRMRNPTHRRFIAMTLKSAYCKFQFEVSQTGAARDGLNFQQISRLAIALPPEAEQELIVRFIEQQFHKIDELIADARNSIALLKERRSALISAAVTGKIDVRGLVDTEAA